MPSTITVYHTFQPATKAKASQVNTNFSNYRGDILPINENTASASDNTHYLGSPDHYWAGAYLGQLDFRTSTNTSSLIIKGDTGNTTGAFLFQIESVTVAELKADGFTGQSLAAIARQLYGQTFTANGSFTIPAGVVGVLVGACGGGGGGGTGGAGNDGANSSGGGGGGGGGCPFQIIGPIPVVSGNVLSITVGSAGAAGVDGSPSLVAGTGWGTLYFPGGARGQNGNVNTTTALAATGGGYAVAFRDGSPVFSGGNGGGTAATSSGTAGSPLTASYSLIGGSNTLATPGSGGAPAGGGNGGGGGGPGGNSSFGAGGNGGNGANNTTSPGSAGGSATTTAYGAGGGGGGGGSETGSQAGGAGGSGIQGIVYIWYILR